MSFSGSRQLGSIFTIEGTSRLRCWVHNQDGFIGCCGVAVVFASCGQSISYALSFRLFARYAYLGSGDFSVEMGVVTICCGIANL